MNQRPDGPPHQKYVNFVTPDLNTVALIWQHDREPVVGDIIRFPKQIREPFFQTRWKVTEVCFDYESERLDCVLTICKIVEVP